MKKSYNVFSQNPISWRYLIHHGYQDIGSVGKFFLALERSVYYSITCGINLLNQFNETLACEPLYTNESKTEIVMHKSDINK